MKRKFIVIIEGRSKTGRDYSNRFVQNNDRSREIITHGTCESCQCPDTGGDKCSGPRDGICPVSRLSATCCLRNNLASICTE